MNHFVISRHAYKQAAKRFKMKDVSLMLTVGEAIEHGKYKTSSTISHITHKGILFIFNQNLLITLYQDPSVKKIKQKKFKHE